jgi:hypothetical protein
MSRQRKGTKPRYGVQFIGYLAKIVAIAAANEILYATIEFVSGEILLHAGLDAEEGFVSAPSRSELAAFVASLPLHADRLREVRRSGHHELHCGENLISIRPTTDIACFISQITNRHAEIGQMLEQVERLGYKIERRPYDDYIIEIARTGRARVVLYGVGLYIDGHLRFHPEHRTALVRPLDPEATQFEGVEVDDNSATPPFIAMNDLTFRQVPMAAFSLGERAQMAYYDAMRRGLSALVMRLADH